MYTYVMQHIERGTLWLCTFLDILMKTFRKKLRKTVKIFDSLSILKFECLYQFGLMGCHSKGLIFETDFTCKVSPFDLLHHTPKFKLF